MSSMYNAEFLTPSPDLSLGLIDALTTRLQPPTPTTDSDICKWGGEERGMVGDTFEGGGGSDH